MIIEESEKKELSFMFNSKITGNQKYKLVYKLGILVIMKCSKIFLKTKY